MMFKFRWSYNLAEFQMCAKSISIIDIKICSLAKIITHCTQTVPCYTDTNFIHINTLKIKCGCLHFKN